MEMLWDQTGPDEDPGARLTARPNQQDWEPALTIERVPMHVEAFAVIEFDEIGGKPLSISHQMGAHEWAAEALDAIGLIDSGSGPSITATINGREYVIVAHPYNR